MIDINRNDWVLITPYTSIIQDKLVTINKRGYLFFNKSLANELKGFNYVTTFINKRDNLIMFKFYNNKIEGSRKICINKKGVYVISVRDLLKITKNDKSIRYLAEIDNDNTIIINLNKPKYYGLEKKEE